MPTPTIPAVTDPLQPLLDSLEALLSARMNQGLSPSHEDYAPTIQSPGLQTVLDSCCPGLGWVRVVRAFPSVNFPQPATTRVGCPDLLFAAEIELGIARCATVPDEEGFVDPDDVTNDALQLGLDRSALFQLVTCDLPPILRAESGGSDCRMTLGEWTPLAEQGGCMGGTIRVTLPYRQCCDDTPDS